MPAIQYVSGSAQTETMPVSKAETKSLKPDGMQAAFSNYMQQSSFNGAQMAKQQAAAKITAETPKTQAGSSDVQQNYAQYQQKTAAQAGKLNSTGETARDTETAVSAEVSEAIEDAVQEIKDAIKEELGVDDKQLEEVMTILGLTDADLFNPQQLTALAVELTGSQDAGMMLFSENFQNILQQVSAVTEELLQELGMTMEQLTEQISRSVQTVQTENAEPQPMPQTPQTAEASPADTANAAAAGALAENQEVQAAEVTQNREVVQTAEISPETHEQVQEVQAQEQPQAVQEKQPQQSEQAEDAPEEPQARTQVQQTAPTEGEAQAGEEESGFSGNADTDTRGRNMQQENNSVFDFHADARQGQQIDTPVANTAANQTPVPQINVEDVIRQIAEYTRVHLTENIKSIEMQLNPANLGKIFLHVTEKAGTITAQLTAQDENVKEALMQQAAILKDNLNQQGIRVNAVEVTVGTHEFESNLEKDARQQEEQARQQEEQSGRRSRRSINLNESDDLDGLSGLMSEEEALVAQIMRDNGNKVDFKA